MIIHEPKIIGSFAYYDLLAEKAGDDVPWHSHPFQHNTVIFLGQWKLGLRKPGGEPVWRHMGRRGRLVVPAGVEHCLIALTAGAEACCEFPHRDRATGEIMDHYDGYREAFS